MPATPADLFSLLERLGVETRTYEHVPVFTVAESQAIKQEIPGGHSKNLFLKDKKGRLFLVVAEAATRIDLKRLHERVVKLQQHFGQANEDVRQILISAEKIERRGTRIQEVEFGGEDRPATDAVVIPAPMPLRLHRGE